MSQSRSPAAIFAGGIAAWLALISVYAVLFPFGAVTAKLLGITITGLLVLTAIAARSAMGDELDWKFILSAVVLVLAVGVAALLVVDQDDPGPQPLTGAWQLSAPGGVGGAEVDGVYSHTLTVCDTVENGRGVRVNYIVEGTSEVQSLGDGDGSKGECGERRIENSRIIRFQVCESDTETGANPVCSDWESIP